MLAGVPDWPPALDLVAIPVFGALSDRVGRRPVYLFGAVMTGVLAFPFFWLLDTGSTPARLARRSLLVITVGHAPMYGPQAASSPSSSARASATAGASLGYQLAVRAAQAAWRRSSRHALLARYGRDALVLYMIGLALVTVVAVLAAAETRGKDLT